MSGSGDRRVEPGTNGANSPDGSLDRELQALRAAWKPQGDAEPPRELDLAILRKAREAATEHASPASRAKNRVWPRAWPRVRPPVWPWTRSWAHNLATVAVVALAATLLLPLDPGRDQRSMPGAAGTSGDTADSAAEVSGNAPHERVDRSRQPAARVKAEQSRAAPPQASATDTAEPRRDSSLRLLETAPAPRTAADRALRAPVADPDAAPDAEIARRLRELKRLREAGDAEAYQQALEAFRADFPDHPLPAGLQP